MLKHSDLFDALPKDYYDTAFLDRMHAYLPGWEVQKLRNEMFTEDYGFIVDYLAEVLKDLRKEDRTFMTIISILNCLIPLPQEIRQLLLKPLLD